MYFLYHFHRSGWGPNWLSGERQNIPGGACPITLYVKASTISGSQMTTVSSGIVAVKCIVQNKSVLLAVDNTFVGLQVD